MNNLLLKICKKEKTRRKKLVCVYLTLGFPSISATRRLILEFEKAGVDIIELGIPFSDPLADGPTIQRASDYALRRGVTIHHGFALVRDLRKRGSKIPILFFSYLNPILHLGIDCFAAEAARSGAQGAIIPDLPPEEGKQFESTFRRHRLVQIYLATPTTSPARLRMIAKRSQGFIYFVSVCGVTGARNKLSRELPRSVRQLKRLTQKPVLIGFGISTPAHVKEVSRFADGVIVGSAVLDAIRRRPGISGPVRFVREMVKAARA